MKDTEGDNKPTLRQCYYAVHLQFTYMAAVRPFRARERFLDGLCRNIKGLEVPPELEELLTATAIKAFGSPPGDRATYSNKALDALDCLLPALQRQEGKKPKNKGEK